MSLQEWTWNTARNACVLPDEWLDLHGADLRGANLRGADLHEADLHEADLSGADLHWADLRGANLHEADLHEADLHGADLRGANLRGANLRWADLDFSCWPLWCGSLNVRVDVRIARQLAYHLCALECDDPEFVQVREACLDFANKMHRDDVPRLKSKKEEG